jgi:hypothetical protein
MHVRGLLEGNFARRLVVLLFVLGLLLTIAIQFEVQAKTNCENHWARRTSARTEALNDTNQALIAATNKFNQATIALANAIPLTQGGDPRPVIAALVNMRRTGADYTTAVSNYAMALRRNPPPPGPANC